MCANQRTLYSCFSSSKMSPGDPLVVESQRLQPSGAAVVGMPARTGVGKFCSGNQIRKFRAAARDKALMVYSGI